MFIVLTAMVGTGPMPSGAPEGREESFPKIDRIILADFSRYPEGWVARGGVAKADAIYEVVENPDGSYLRAREGTESVRLFKKIPWDSKTYPVVEWRWRVKKWPESGSGRVTVYIALDRDVLGIPAMTKYHWGRDEAEGEVQEGGLFRPSERVIQSGGSGSGEWIIERVDARADFRAISGRDPRGEAYGIGILVDPGIEAEIGEIVAMKE